jgi:hypothetical protein
MNDKELENNCGDSRQLSGEIVDALRHTTNNSAKVGRN